MTRLLRVGDVEINIHMAQIVVFAGSTRSCCIRSGRASVRDVVPAAKVVQPQAAVVHWSSVCVRRLQHQTLRVQVRASQLRVRGGKQTLERVSRSWVVEAGEASGARDLEH